MMCFIFKLIFSVAFAATKLTAVYSSIRFDEVEFYDPNKTLDESTSNGFVCSHLGEGCQISAQCCGVATCALPSWSDTPVCLVPGYKHDERFRKRFFSLHNLRPADIRYIRDSYNTSQYDFLLTDLTVSAPPLDVASSEVIAANVTVYNGTGDALGDHGTVHSVESGSAEEFSENSETMNASVVENYENNSSTLLTDENSERGLNDSTASLPHVSLLNDSDVTDINSSSISLTNSSTINDFAFKNHFMFLLINNTLGQSGSNLEMKEFYDQFLNTNRFKNIVDQLRKKLREINDVEKNVSSNGTKNATVFIYNSKEIGKPTTEKTKTTQKLSKWSVVKKFFFRSKERANENRNTTNKKNTDHLKNIVEEIRSIELPTDISQENINGERILQSVYPDNPRDNEGFKKLIEDVDKIEEIIDSDRTINKLRRSKTVNDQGLCDFYNINVPFSSFDGVTEKAEGSNNSLESVFKDIGDKINLMLLETDNKEESAQNNLETKETPKSDSKEISVQQNSEEYSVSNQSTKPKSGSTLNETHFWDKIYFWKVPRNISAEVEKSIKRFFFPKEELSTSEKQNKQTPLNEYFLLNMNSKNTQATATPLRDEQIEKTSEYSSHLSSAESKSSSTEELYNNSYVFMVHKERFEEPLKESSWKKVVHFFRREKEAPLALEVNIHDIPSRIFWDSENRPSEMESENNPSIDVPNIIRLPEYLMPQVLDERQANETDWIFDDSEDLEDRIIEEHKSNSSFFFFFK